MYLQKYFNIWSCFWLNQFRKKEWLHLGTLCPTQHEDIHMHRTYTGTCGVLWAQKTYISKVWA